MGTMEGLWGTSVSLSDRDLGVEVGKTWWLKKLMMHWRIIFRVRSREMGLTKKRVLAKLKVELTALTKRSRQAYL